MPNIEDGAQEDKEEKRKHKKYVLKTIEKQNKDKNKDKQARRVLFTLMLGVVVSVVKPVLFKAMSSCQVKKLVVELLERYVKSTDNDVDDLIASTVKTALLKGCE